MNMLGFCESKKAGEINVDHLLRNVCPVGNRIGPMVAESLIVENTMKCIALHDKGLLHVISMQ